MYITLLNWDIKLFSLYAIYFVKIHPFCKHLLPFQGSMYRLHNSSEHSGVTNMYSLSNAGGSSRANTPLPQLSQQQRQQQQTQQYLIDDLDQVQLLQNQQLQEIHA